MSDRTCWRVEISRAMLVHGDAWQNLVAIAPADSAWLDEMFDPGYGSQEGCSFTLWTQDRVYFPIVYDGAEWAGSAARNPDREPTAHQGGG